MDASPLEIPELLVRMAQDVKSSWTVTPELEAIVRELAVECAPCGIRLNAVRSGLVESDVIAHMPQELPADVARRTPLGRLGTTAEIAAVAEFLLSPEASWVTGQVIEVDGGFSVV